MRYVWERSAALVSYVFWSWHRTRVVGGSSALSVELDDQFQAAGAAALSHALAILAEAGRRPPSIGPHAIRLGWGGVRALSQRPGRPR